MLRPVESKITKSFRFPPTAQSANPRRPVETGIFDHCTVREPEEACGKNMWRLIINIMACEV
jgi:hypothetical protein